jgi:hypothetical protein
MTIKLSYNRAFDIEDVCPGDVLVDRADQSLMFAVVHSDPDTEEFICIRVNEVGAIRALMTRIGYELIDQFLKVEVDEETL